MHKNAMKCNKTQRKWCVNKHGASKIIDTFETYQPSLWLPYPSPALAHPLMHFLCLISQGIRRPITAERTPMPVSPPVMACRWPRSWEPQEECMMSTAASLPSVWNQGLSYQYEKEPTSEGWCSLALRQFRTIYIWRLIWGVALHQMQCGTCTQHNQVLCPNLQ
jgi:hypothetical protein